MNKTVNPQVTDAVAETPVSEAVPTAVNSQITDAVTQSDANMTDETTKD